MAKNKERQEHKVVLSKDKSQCQKPEVQATGQEKKQQAAEKKEQKQPSKKAEENASLQAFSNVCGIILIMMLCAVIGHQIGSYRMERQKSEEYAVEQEEQEKNKEQLQNKIEEQERQFAEEKDISEKEKDILEKEKDNLIDFLEIYDKVQEVSYTKLENEKVLFVNIPISEEAMFRNEYEIYDNNNLPIYLKLSELKRIDRDTKLYVHFSGMPETWTVESISKIGGDLYYFPYTNGNETYYCWKLSTSILSARYCVEFNPHNDEDPYYLTLWWPGNY